MTYLHLRVPAGTFARFSLMGVLLRPLLEPLANPASCGGVGFMCFVPSTLSLMIFHSQQLTVCAFIVRHYARRPDQGSGAAVRSGRMAVACGEG